MCASIRTFTNFASKHGTKRPKSESERINDQTIVTVLAPEGFCQVIVGYNFFAIARNAIFAIAMQAIRCLCDFLHWFMAQALCLKTKQNYTNAHNNHNSLVIRMKNNKT